MVGLSEQEIRQGLEEELVRAMRVEGETPTIHALAHAIARVLERDHLRLAEQLAQAGIALARPDGPGAAYARRIVLGFDGSEHAQRALQRVLALAGPETTVAVVMAVDHASPAPEEPGEGKQRPLPEDALAAAEEQLVQGGVAARAVELTGDPAAAILDTAEDEDADLIVVGTRGRSLAGRIALGSVSTRVLHRAPCDVLVVR